ncbi:MAG: nucleotide exchange factor GrpE [Cardiobacteriaceae bacterium]|nr:nucleotide exchange factor GrpE [Cardiobacteriaceae bacterium]
MTQDNHDTTPPTEDTPELEIDLDQAVPAEETAADASAEEIATLHAQIAALKDQFIRERAENENLRKRHERDLSNAHKYGSERLLKDLLPVLDSLALGIDAARQSEDECMKRFTEGSEMTLKLFVDTLAKHGIEELNPVGEKFNPEYHEAVTALPNGEVEPNTVLHVAQKGYVLNGRSIRAAQVVVSRAP